MPPRVSPRGVEFIEFAASHEEAEQFGRMFAALGFAPVARHRSKDSRAVGKRVFFEVVERRDYQAYGAVNASIRLNAQAQYR